MNIQNLNEQELEQLQGLLNKMNPPQPTEKIYLDPVNEMIDDIMENMDWGQIQSTMEYLEWKWRDEYVTIDMLKNQGRKLLNGAADNRLDEYTTEHHELSIMNGTGGLEARAWCNEDKTQIVRLDLAFVLNRWDEEIKEK